MKTGFWRYIGSFATVLAAASLCPVYSAGHAPQIAWTGSHGTNAVRVLAFSADGSRLASAGDGARVCLWDTATGERVGTLSNGESGIAKLWFRSDGTLMSWDTAATLKRWRLSDRSVLSQQSMPPGFYDNSGGPTFSEAGELFVAVKFEGTGWPPLFAWRFGTATPLFETHTNGTVTLSPDGSELAVAAFYGSSWLDIDLYQTTDWSLRLKLQRFDGFFPTAPLIYGNDGSILMMPIWGGGYFWRMPTGEFYSRLIVDDCDPRYEPFFHQLTPDARMVVIASARGVKFWEVVQAVEGRQWEPLLVYEEGLQGVRSLALSPNGKLIALGFADGRVLAMRMPVIIRSAQYERNDLRLEWLGPSGPYQVQRRESIDAGDWRDYGPPLTEPVVSLPLPGNQAFFRVVGLP